MYIFKRYDYIATASFFRKYTLNNTLIFTLNLILHHGNAVLVFIGYICSVDSDVFWFTVIVTISQWGRRNKYYYLLFIEY